MKKLDAYKVYLGMEGTLALLFDMIFTASAVYQVTIAGLSPLQLVLVGTTLEVAVFVFEVPTGVVADVYSRRLSVIIGMFLIGLGFIVEGSFPLFWTIILAQVLWGVGYTFTSGATQAWISDEIGEAAAGRAFLRSSQVGQIMGLVGIGLGVALGNIRVSLPIQVGGFCLILLGISLALVMPEAGFKSVSKEERNSWVSMVTTLQEGLRTARRRPGLLTILGIGFIYGLYSEGLDRLWTKHLLDNFVLPAWVDWQPVVWIGLIRAAGMLLSIGATEVAYRRINTDNRSNVARTLFMITAVLVVSLFGFALAFSFALAILCYWIISTSRNLISPIYTAWVNQRLDSRVRATVLSMSSQVDAIGQIAGGPAVGLIGSLLSVRAALVSSSLILTSALPLFQRASRQSSQSESLSR